MRAIIHRVIKNWRAKEAEISQLADDFITSVKRLILDEDLQPKIVFTAEQNRFEKRLHSDRILRLKGVEIVRASVASVNATTHSHMIMSVVSMEGELLGPMYVLVSDPTGKFLA